MYSVEREIILYNFPYLGGVFRWQNVKCAVKAQYSVFRYLTLTEEVTEPGSQISEKLEQLLTVRQRKSTFVPNVCVLKRLSELYN